MDAADLGQGFGRHVADVVALDRDHTVVGTNLACELLVPDVNRDHRACAPLAQHLREPTGRCAHVEGEPARDVDVKSIERGDELVCGAAHIVIGCRNLQHRRLGDARRSAHHALAINRDYSGGNQLRRVCARTRKASRYQRGIESLHVFRAPALPCRCRTAQAATKTRCAARRTPAPAPPAVALQSRARAT